MLPTILATPYMMIRSSMYASALSSSESDSEPDEPVIREQPRIYRAPSIDEDEKRVVRSAKDKRYEEMQTVIRNLNNHKKIKDMGSIFKDFEDLIKVYEKSKKMNYIEGVPNFYIKHIADLEDFVNESWESRKNLTKGTANALTKLKQRVKRYNRDFEQAIKLYRENPDAYREDVEEEGEDEMSENQASSDHQDARLMPSKKSFGPGDESTDEDDIPLPKKKAVDSYDDNEDRGESDSEDDSWGSSSDSSDNLDRQMEEFKDNPAAFFLKKTEPDGKVR
ncbi:unnamed protein product [Protopolystoma xenopodis]|uniref:Eukaryotic translation initiation factor 3 subunit C N-terminal domain-containing protein n=1 Tax=Protopolystoma xenopodis TaxID=117903 RepID=A0A3S5A7J5_9PLAT|nr:unnamed protein product [Protopolystoma xenopodis]